MKGHPTLPQRPTLSEIQAYVANTNEFRGHSTALQTCLLLLCEEVGELAKATRKQSGIRMDTAKQYDSSAAEEAADVLWMLCSICNSLGVDLEAAMREKEERNKMRVWQ